jgi:hypothetical protein
MKGKFYNQEAFYLELNRRIEGVDKAAHPFSELGRIREIILVNRKLDSQNPKLNQIIKELYKRQGDILFRGNNPSLATSYYSKSGMSDIEIQDYIRFLRQS